MSWLFWLFGLFALVSAIVAVSRRSPIYAALFLLGSLANVSVLFLLLHAPFIAAMQIILYTGAIVVLFVFVIMLLSLKPDELGDEPPKSAKGMALAVALATFVLLAMPAFGDGKLKGLTDGGRFRALEPQVKMSHVVAVVARRHGLTPAELKSTQTPVAEDPSSDEPNARNVHYRVARTEAAYLGSLLCAGGVPEVSAGLDMVATKVKGQSNQITRMLAQDGDAVAAQKSRVDAMKTRVLADASDFGSIQHFVQFLYTKYMVVFELVSVLIFAALVGVIVMARRRGFMGAGEEQNEGGGAL